MAKRGERVRHLGGEGRGRWVELERGGVAFGEHPVQRQCVKVRVRDIQLNDVFITTLRARFTS